MKYRENFKLAYENKPNYQVDEKKKSVKCHLTCKIIAPDSLHANKIMDNVIITANGYAKCDNKDVFNPETGKKIALARAESLAYHKAAVLIRQCAFDAEKFLDAAMDFEDKSDFVQEHNDCYIKRQFCTTSNCCDKKRDDKGRFVSGNDMWMNQNRDKNGRFVKPCCTTVGVSGDFSENKPNKGKSLKINRTYSD